MSFLQSIGDFTIGLIIPFLFVLTLIVFVHEMGHFLVARWNGVTVKVFSVGFGPELLGYTDRRGTRWKLSVIPLGGYVRFLGDENVASAEGREAVGQLSDLERETAFVTQSVGRRAAIVAAGPIANFILAILIFAFLYSVVGRDVMPPIVSDVVIGSPAEGAGFEAGDLIVAANDSPIETIADLQRVVSTRAGQELVVRVNRTGTLLDIPVTPAMIETEDGFGGVYRRGQIGIESHYDPDAITRSYTPFPQSVWEGAGETWFVVSQTVRYLGRVVSAQEAPDQLGGPITVARVAERAASVGFVSLLALAAYLSVSVGFVNLLPIPLLDGGHLAFYAAERLRGRPLGDRAQEIGYRVGFALVLSLIVLVSVLDISRLA